MLDHVKEQKDTEALVFLKFAFVEGLDDFIA